MSQANPTASAFPLKGLSDEDPSRSGFCGPARRLVAGGRGLRARQAAAGTLLNAAVVATDRHNHRDQIGAVVSTVQSDKSIRRSTHAIRGIAGQPARSEPGEILRDLTQPRGRVDRAHDLEDQLRLLQAIL